MQAKRRARVVTLAAALPGSGLVAALLVLHGDALTDEVELWRIRLAGGAVILPAAGGRGETVDVHAGDIEVEALLRFIADSTGRAIIVEADMRQSLGGTITMASRMDDVTATIAIRILQVNGFAFVERPFRGGAWSLCAGRIGLQCK